MLCPDAFSNSLGMSGLVFGSGTFGEPSLKLDRLCKPIRLPTLTPLTSILGALDCSGCFRVVVEGDERLGVLDRRGCFRIVVEGDERSDVLDLLGSRFGGFGGWQLLKSDKLPFKNFIVASISSFGPPSEEVFLLTGTGGTSFDPNES